MIERVLDLSARRSSATRPEIRWAVILVACLGAAAAASCGTSGPAAEALPEFEAGLTTDRWAASQDLAITVESDGQSPLFATSDFSDFKPSWSSTGSMLTFFRLLSAPGDFYTWKTKLSVVAADGSGYRALTSGDHADFNPSWTRDGSNLIIFNRYAVRGPTSNDVYLASPTGSPGQEVLISNPENGYEWAHSGLKDGRILVERIAYGGTRPEAKTFLLTPNPGGAGSYQQVSRPSPLLWHKLTVSPSETKVAYMLDQDWDTSTYQDVVLAYADFDAASGVISNPVAITTPYPTCIHEYPAWNADESLIIYDSNCSGVYQMYAYRLADGTTHRISPDPGLNYQFGCFENVPK